MEQPQHSGGARRALVIDDEPVIRYALRRFFERQGWLVDEAADGVEALDRLLDDGPGAVAYDVIITDLRMPQLSGIELCRRLERDRPTLLRRVILSTGDTVSPDTASFLERTPCPVLSKPFELAELRALVSRVAGAP